MITHMSEEDYFDLHKRKMWDTFYLIERSYQKYKYNELDKIDIIDKNILPPNEWTSWYVNNNNNNNVNDWINNLKELPKIETIGGFGDWKDVAYYIDDHYILDYFIFRKYKNIDNKPMAELPHHQSGSIWTIWIDDKNKYVNLFARIASLLISESLEHSEYIYGLQCSNTKTDGTNKISLWCQEIPNDINIKWCKEFGLDSMEFKKHKQYHIKSKYIHKKPYQKNYKKY
jgi:hypothetical protein